MLNLKSICMMGAAALVLGSVATASAAPAVTEKTLRDTLATVKTSQLEADATKYLSQKLKLDVMAIDGDYVFCARKDLENAGCNRILVIEGHLSGNNASQTFVFHYTANQSKPQVQLLEVEYRDTVDSEVPFTRFNKSLPIFLAALAKLENIYIYEEIIRSKPAYHPYSMKIVALESNSERDMSREDDQWIETASTDLISFGESTYSTVVSAEWSYNYVVKSESDGAKLTVKSVKELKL